jgi:hypothetical protein
MNTDQYAPDLLAHLNACAEIAWIDWAQCHETTAVRCRSPFWPAWPSWGGWRADEFSECASPF